MLTSSDLIEIDIVIRKAILESFNKFYKDNLLHRFRNDKLIRRKILEGISQYEKRIRKLESASIAS